MRIENELRMNKNKGSCLLLCVVLGIFCTLFCICSFVFVLRIFFYLFCGHVSCCLNAASGDGAQKDRGECESSTVVVSLC